MQLTCGDSRRKGGAESASTVKSVFGQPFFERTAARRVRQRRQDGGQPMTVWHLADVTMTPSVSSLPGGGTLQELTNGLGAWALIASLAGLVVGAAAWALGVHSQNYQQSLVGRRAVLVSGLAALLIGAAPPVVNFFFHAGANLH